MTVVLYARVSSEEQRERQTIENQVEFFRKYCDLHSLEPGGTYLDDGVSGTVPLEERPGGTALLQGARAGKFSEVLLYKLDRLGRDPRIILNAVHALEQTGIIVKSMSEPFDTSSTYGRFMLTVLGGIAGLEREVLLERSAIGTARAARAGRWLGGIVPYGYRVNADGYLEVCEDLVAGTNLTEAGVLRLIFDLVARRRWSCVKIADHLNALGIPPAYTLRGRAVLRGKRKVATAGIWRPSRVRNLIINPTYKGIHKYGKRSPHRRELIARQVPAITDEMTWQRAQDALHENRLEALRNAKRRYLLRGLVKCGTCGLSYCGVHYASAGDPPGRKAYYVCNGKTAYRGPLQGKCDSKNVPAVWLEETVWADILRFAQDPGEALALLEQDLETEDDAVTRRHDELLDLQEALDRIDAQREKVLTLFRRGVIGEADVENQLAQVEAERLALEEKVETARRNLVEIQARAERLAQARGVLEELKERVGAELTWEEKRDIVKALVKEVIVETRLEGGRKQANVVVRYGFPHIADRTGRDWSPPPA